MLNHNDLEEMLVGWFGSGSTCFKLGQRGADPSQSLGEESVDT